MQKEERIELKNRNTKVCAAGTGKTSAGEFFMW